MNQNTLWIEQLKLNEQGLIPAIAQDYQDSAVLMMAWMNRESIQRTLETGEAYYWSRSRAELWHKGATSGHIQKVKQLLYDCDADTLLLKIEQMGDAACHTGARSCFFNTVQLSFSHASMSQHRF
ncbi:MAG: phosphoribosyl-AMP cyclohydrolase [Aphanocapsa sp. GSE-SYN-MK-11-07L]|jgi:phosphoribosyl-AMP cyclohydrolase/phosphoribosyl-ATP pyrophosphohydrolase/phosphoribosyl-AMP cyclohydrolase|nr:phosphoribosyl-AMP cyclohydrolase [Aphanocapsa sp. GSE-SYN-MK-11-07L]